MADLQQFPAKICFTTAAFLIHEGKILLVKHKKLGFWLAPGGHVEPNELPHVAAQRECFEETKVKVVAFDEISASNDSYYSSLRTENLPNPILTNLHWVCRENFDARIKDPEHFKPLPPWAKGCEQHLNFIYLVRPVAGTEAIQNEEESDDIGWFTVRECEALNTTEDIRFEIRHAFHLLGLQ